MALPVYQLPDEPIFPPPEEAEPSGLLAVGGDLSMRRLLAAYSMGIFPWYSEGEPILWFSPDPRMVLRPQDLHLSKSLRKALRRAPYDLRLDTDFEQVIDACASAPRAGQQGTWITKAMRRAYVALHAQGLAHSAEAWEEGELVGGLYGVSLGGCFFGESMFACRPDASKLAFAALLRHLEKWGIHLIDCQVHTEHLERFGATPWPREEFLQTLEEALRSPTRRGQWRFAGQIEEGSRES